MIAVVLLLVGLGSCTRNVDPFLSQLMQQSFDWYNWTNWAYGPTCVHPPALVPLDATEPSIATALSQLDAGFTKFIAGLLTVNLTLGISVEIVYDQVSLLSKSYGVTNAVSMQKPTRDTVYRLGSISKIFTSLLFMKAVQHGVVHLDSKVTDFYNAANPPMFNITNPFKSGPVTLHALACHSAGMPREAFSCQFTDACQEATVFAGLSMAALLAPAYKLPHYSNLGIALLGRCVARGYNQSFENLIDNEILPVIGMMNSGMIITPDVRPKMATGYHVTQTGNTYSQAPDPYYSTNIGWVAPAGNMYATPRDMSTFLKYIFSEDQSILNTDYQRQWRLPGVVFPDGLSGFGLGTWEQFFANGFATTTKGGLITGFGSQIGYVDDLKLGVAVTINADDGIDMDAICAGTLRALVPAVLAALNAQQPAKPLPTNYQNIAGSYGVSGQAYVTIGQPTNGVFPVTSPFVGQPISMWWEPNLDYANMTGLRYSFGSPTQSCGVEYMSGSDAVAYVTGVQNGTAMSVSLFDYGVGFIPKL